MYDLEQTFLREQSLDIGYGESIAEYIIHEFAHLQTYKNGKFSKIYKDISFTKPKSILSGSSYGSKNYREFIAEAFLAKAKGIPDEIIFENEEDRSIYDKYISILPTEQIKSTLIKSIKNYDFRFAYTDEEY